MWGFNIEKVTGKDGKLIEPDTAMVRGFLSVPKPFDAKITVRSPQHASVIRKSFQEAEKSGDF